MAALIFIACTGDCCNISLNVLVQMGGTLQTWSFPCVFGRAKMGRFENTLLWTEPELVGAHSGLV